MVGAAYAAMNGYRTSCQCAQCVSRMARRRCCSESWYTPLNLKDIVSFVPKEPWVVLGEQQCQVYLQTRLDRLTSHTREALPTESKIPSS